MVDNVDNVEKKRRTRTYIDDEGNRVSAKYDDTRIGEEELLNAYNLGSRFSVPQELLDAYPERVWSWIGHTDIEGEELRSNYQAYARLGYRAALSTDHPSLSQRLDIPEDMFATKSSNNYIMDQGHMLVWCPREDHERRMGIYKKEDQNQNRKILECTNNEVALPHNRMRQAHSGAKFGYIQ